METNEAVAYLAGFVASDGHLSRKRLSIELSDKDEDVLYQIKNLFPKGYVNKRTRKVAFGNNSYLHSSAIYNLHDVKFIQNLSDKFNIPVDCKKSKILEFPKLSKEIERHYVRGIIDGDGSLGFLNDGRPYVSLITTSSKFANSYCNFIKENIGIAKTTSPNKRDKAHNMMLYSDNAKRLVGYLYKDSNIALDRKLKMSNKIMQWIRHGRKECQPKRWTLEQDNIILSMPVKEAVNILGRTKPSIEMRKWRLSKTNN